MNQPAKTNEQDKQELTPQELEQLSGGVHVYTPPDPC